MRTLSVLILGSSLLGLSGCIVYDHDCVGCAPGERYDRDGPSPCPDEDGSCDQGSSDGGSATDTGTAGDSGEPEQELSYTYVLTPDEAEAGETFIASLHAVGDDAPGYDAIEDVHFYGAPEVDVLATDSRDYEYLLVASIPEDSETGSADLLVELSDGTAVFVESVLQVYEAGSGHSAGSSDDGSFDPCE